MLGRWGGARTHYLTGETLAKANNAASGLGGPCAGSGRLPVG